MNISELLSDRAKRLEPSPIRELFKYSQNKEIISFGGGYPAPGTFPIKEVTLNTIYGQQICIGSDCILSLLQYGPSFGDPALLGLISKWHTFKNDIKLNIEDFLILNGSQEGIFALGFLLINDNDLIVVSEPTYPGTISAFNAFKPRYLSVPLTSAGMDLNFLETKLNKTARKPKFIYVIPNGHNPGGVTMDLESRKRLLNISYKFDVPIIEDDPYELVRYHNDPLPTIQALDTKDMVIRLDSFSKILIPGFRIGYASGPSNIIKLLELYKQSSNLHTSSFAQGLMCHYLKTVGFEGFMEHINKISSYYKGKMEFMSDMLNEHLKGQISYNKPDSGLFIWLAFKNIKDTKKLLFDNVDRLKVMAVPGNSFSTLDLLHNCMRLSFGTLDNEVIKEGIIRLKQCIML